MKSQQIATNNFDCEQNFDESMNGWACPNAVQSCDAFTDEDGWGEAFELMNAKHEHEAENKLHKIFKLTAEIDNLYDIINDCKTKLVKLEAELEDTRETRFELLHEKYEYLKNAHENFEPNTLNIEYDTRCPDCGHVERPYRGCRCE
jgi:hypothetical protein